MSRHIKKVLEEDELDENRVCAKNARTGRDGESLYHLETSLNYAGKKTFAITKMEKTDLITALSLETKPC